MRTQVNPGSLLEVQGSFEFVELPASSALGDVADIIEKQTVIIDRESGSMITLHGLLRTFMEDPDEVVTGPIRIRIESALLAPGAQFEEVPLVAFLADDPGGLWKKDDVAIDVGPEAPGSPVHSFMHFPSRETISLSEAYSRNLVRKIGNQP